MFIVRSSFRAPLSWNESKGGKLWPSRTDSAFYHVQPHDFHFLLSVPLLHSAPLLKFYFSWDQSFSLSRRTCSQRGRWCFVFRKLSCLDASEPVSHFRMTVSLSKQNTQAKIIMIEIKKKKHTSFPHLAPRKYRVRKDGALLEFCNPPTNPSTLTPFKECAPITLQQHNICCTRFSGTNGSRVARNPTRKQL